VCPDPKYRMSPVYLFEGKKGDKRIIYLVLGSVAGAVLSRFSKQTKPYTIVLTVPFSGSVQGTPFLWPVRVLDDDEDNSWLTSASIAMTDCEGQWMKVQRSETEYYTEPPGGKLPDPKWPEESFQKLLLLAFGKRVIKSMDHPALLAAEGIM
jgi:hypothetical protein